MRVLSTVLLAFVLLFLGDQHSLAAAQEQDEDELEEADAAQESDEDELEEEDAAQEPDEDEEEEEDVPHFLDSMKASSKDASSLPPGHTENIAHSLGAGCIEVVESIEREIGNFDDMSHSDEVRRLLAKKIAEHAKELLLPLGKEATADFEDNFYNKLIESASPGGTPGKISSGQDGFGSSDVCEFLLKHHDEL